MKILYQVKSPRFTFFHTITVTADEGSNVHAIECVLISSFTQTHMILGDLYI